MMSQLPNISASARAEGRARPRWRTALIVLRGAHLEPRAARARRVTLVLIFLWVLNIFDLLLTMLAHQIGHFVEVNPLARGLLASPAALVAFKLTMLSFATGVFFAFRKRLLTEVACWCLTAAYIVLSVVWLRYYYGHPA